MRVTREIQYGLYGVFYLAYNGEDHPVPVREIGKRLELPTRYLEQIFQTLRRAALVESKRGPGGGYVLARSSSEISIEDVFVALKGAVLELDHEEPEVEERPRFVWEFLQERVRPALGSISLAELCREAAQRGVPRAETDPAMYHI